MPIDPLSSSSALLAALRAEVAGKAERSARQKATQSAMPAERAVDARKRDAAALRSELAKIVKGVSSADSEALNAVRPKVVRAILLWEFGPELREYSEWQPMLDTLVRTLEANDQHRDAFTRLVRELQMRR